MGTPPCSLAPPTLPVRTLGPGSGSVSLLRPGTWGKAVSSVPRPCEAPLPAPLSQPHPPLRTPLHGSHSPRVRTLALRPPPSLPQLGLHLPRGLCTASAPGRASPPCTQDPPLHRTGPPARQGQRPWLCPGPSWPWKSPVGRSSSSRPLFSPRPPEIAASRVPAALPTDVTRCPAAAEIAAEGIPPPPCLRKPGTHGATGGRRRGHRRGPAGKRRSASAV